MSALLIVFTMITTSCTKEEEAAEEKEPTLITVGSSDVMFTSAKASGNVVDDGGLTVELKGIVYGTSANPVINGANWTNMGDGEGEFTSSITNLSTNTTYYYRTYATTQDGKTFYGSDMTFTTLR